VLPFSQFRIVQDLTPIRSAACVCVSLISSRRFLRCSPKVWGSKSDCFGFSALSVTGTNCKRATRPCPCGWLGHPSGKCRCTPDAIARYRGRISGPLADRIDIKIEVAVPREAELAARTAGESSAEVRRRVVAARERQHSRQGRPNALLEPRDIEQHCALDAEGEQLLRQAFARLDLSARAYHRVLRVARSIADLAEASAIGTRHIAEAIQYRRLDASL
jgi:magnesium chelatase family protein